MLSYLGKRLVGAVFVLAGLSVVIFLIARVVPGDPVRMALGPQAPQAVVEDLRKQLHLDKPLHVQYYYWVSGAVRGDFGISLMTNRPVTADLKEYLPATLELVLFASILHGLFGLILGIVAAAYSDSWLDNFVRVFAYIGVTTPGFVFAVLFMLIFGYWWHLLPVIGRIGYGVTVPPTITGMMTVDSLLTGNLPAFADALKHLILPSVALSMGAMSQEARITRSSMVENLNKDYIYMSVAQGIPRRIIMRKYLLKPSLIPTVTVFGLGCASTMAGAFLVELIFNWPGFARYGITGMLMKDLNVISATVLVVALCFVVVNIIVDLVVAYLDPRIRLQ
ncbi:MAG: ABC transporter permease [Bacillota bacterium]|nr:ABC transporter permease [Bacillota bacterium]